MNDDIIALSTPPGNGGVALIRISGFSLKEKILPFIKEKKKFKRQLAYAIKPYSLIHHDETIDKVMISWFEAPRSFTGEDVLEINCHGGFLLASKIISLLIKKGFRQGENGEFSKRAFLNGKMSLWEAEGMNAVIHAQSDLEVKSGILQLEGKLDRTLRKIKDQFVTIWQEFTLCIDFEEHVETEIDYAQLTKRLEEIKKGFSALIDSKKRFDRLHRGYEILVTGRPNSGKSSLVNQLLGSDEIIVHHEEGTTRDIIEKDYALKQIPVKLIDTAGLRDTDDKVEKIGLEKSKEKIKTADLVLYVMDISRNDRNELDMEYLRRIGKMVNEENVSVLTVMNKIDLTEKEERSIERAVPFSAKTGENKEELIERMYQLLSPAEQNQKDLFYIANRQFAILLSLLEKTEELILEIKGNNTPDIYSFYVNEIMEDLNRLTIETKDEDMINDIFANFCIGK